MRTVARLLFVMSVASLLHAHHGPGIRGFNPNDPLVISGVITRCVDCSNGSRGHGVVLIQVDSVMWEATLPDTPRLRKAKVSLSKLKKGTAVKVAGFANVSKTHKIYANEIIVKGVRLFGDLQH
jgi:hypothetical protein